MPSELKRYVLAGEDASIPPMVQDPLRTLVERHPDLRSMLAVAKNCGWTARHRALAAQKLEEMLALDQHVSPALIAAKASGLAEHYWRIRRHQQFWRQVKRIVDWQAARVVDQEICPLKAWEPGPCCIDLKFTVSTLRGVPERLHIEVDQTEPAARIETIVHLGREAIRIGSAWEGARQVLFDDAPLRDLLGAIAERAGEPRTSLLPLTFVSDRPTTITLRFIATAPKG